MYGKRFCSGYSIAFLSITLINSKRSPSFTAGGLAKGPAKKLGTHTFLLPPSLPDAAYSAPFQFTNIAFLGWLWIVAQVLSLVICRTEAPPTSARAQIGTAFNRLFLQF